MKVMGNSKAIYKPYIVVPEQNLQSKWERVNCEDCESICEFNFAWKTVRRQATRSFICSIVGGMKTNPLQILILKKTGI